VYFCADHPIHPTVVKGFEVDGQGKMLDLIAISHDGSCTSDMVGATKRIEGCKVHDTGIGNYYYGIVVAPNHGTTVANVEILDNEVYHTAWSALTVYPWYQGATNAVRDVVIRGNHVHDTLGPQGSHGIMMCGDDVDNVLIERNYVHDIAHYGLEFCSKAASGIHGIVARHNVVTRAGRGIDFWAGYPGNNYDVTCYGNIIYGNTNGVRFSSSVNGRNIAFRMYNNVLFQNGGPAEIYMDVDPVFSVFELKNNIFYSDRPAYLDSSGSTEITAHAANLYYRPGGGDPGDDRWGVLRRRLDQRLGAGGPQCQSAAS
jgi:hypothetical protein